MSTDNVLNSTQLSETDAQLISLSTYHAAYFGEGRADLPTPPPSPSVPTQTELLGISSSHNSANLLESSPDDTICDSDFDSSIASTNGPTPPETWATKRSCCHTNFHHTFNGMTYLLKTCGTWSFDNEVEKLVRVFLNCVGLPIKKNCNLNKHDLLAVLHANQTAQVQRLISQNIPHLYIFLFYKPLPQTPESEKVVAVKVMKSLHSYFHTFSGGIYRMEYAAQSSATRSLFSFKREFDWNVPAEGQFSSARFDAPLSEIPAFAMVSPSVFSLLIPIFNGFVLPDMSHGPKSKSTTTLKTKPKKPFTPIHTVPSLFLNQKSPKLASSPTKRLGETIDVDAEPPFKNARGADGIPTRTRSRSDSLGDHNTAPPTSPHTPPQISQNYVPTYATSPSSELANLTEAIKLSIASSQEDRQIHERTLNLLEKSVMMQKDITLATHKTFACLQQQFLKTEATSSAQHIATLQAFKECSSRTTDTILSVAKQSRSEFTSALDEFLKVQQLPQQTAQQSADGDIPVPPPPPTHPRYSFSGNTPPPTPPTIISINTPHIPQSSAIFKREIDPVLWTFDDVSQIRARITINNSAEGQPLSLMYSNSPHALDAFTEAIHDPGNLNIPSTISEANAKLILALRFDQVSIVNFFPSNKKNPPTETDLLTGLHWFRRYVAHVFGVNFSEAIDKLASTTSNILRDESALTVAHIIHLLDSRLFNLRKSPLRPTSNPLDPLSDVTCPHNTLACKNQLNYQLSFRRSDPDIKRLMERLVSNLISTALRQDTPQTRVTPSVRPTPPRPSSAPPQPIDWSTCPITIQKDRPCFNWIKKTKDCKSSVCGLRQPRPHSFAAGTSKADKDAYSSWVRSVAP